MLGRRRTKSSMRSFGSGRDLMEHRGTSVGDIPCPPPIEGERPESPFARRVRERDEGTGS